MTAKKKNNLNNNHLQEQPKISLCMIVKNEARWLSRCLNSVKGLVNEMIIVDTGSTDETVKIAKGYGANVFHHPWNDNFSESRNYALKHAAGDWILHLDADEELVQEDIPLVKGIIKKKELNGVYCLFYSTQNASSGHSKFFLPRLFRNNIGICYRGRIHETPVIPGNTSFSNIRIIHYGYSLDEVTMATKRKRNASILLEEVRKNPKDVALHFYLAKNYYEQELYDLSLKEGEAVLTIFSNDNIAKKPELEIFLIMAYSHYNKGNYQEAERLCTQAIERKPNYIDPYFFLGHLYLMQDKYASSIASFQRYFQIKDTLKKNPEFNHLVIYSFTKSHEAHAGLGTAFGKLGNYAASINQFKKAISICPQFAEAYNGLGVIHGYQGRLDNAVTYLKTALQIKPVYSEAYKNLGIVYAMQEKSSLAIEAFKKVIQINPDIAEIHNDLGVVLAKEGRFEHAIQSFKRAIEINPNYSRASNNLMLTYKKLHENSLATPITEQSCLLY
ncbi:MAG: tetratricopeptide repeat protein [Candidatus Brocadiales bacterium]|nr:tetratricopeptide repeat protein [Candidatus Brocadiales bacterium]